MNDRRSFLKGLAIGGALAATGEAFAGEPLRGRVTAAGKPMAGVVVSDGRVCAETAADGTYALPARDGVRFVSITIPSGWRIGAHYLKFNPARTSYDFDLKPWAQSKPGPFTICHVGDSEISDASPRERAWIKRNKEFADERDCAFIVHTGDICAAAGLKNHIELMNSENMGRPVFYVLGNHDVIAPVKGEATFEKYYGPCWYSFDCGGVHFVTLPMTWGDGKVSFTVEEVVAWLRNDLAIASRKRQPVMLLIHGCYDSYILDLTRIYEESRIMTMDSDPFDVVKACDFRAIIHGHLHVNYCRRSEDRRLTVISVAPPQKQLSTLQVIHVDAACNLRCENRYGHTGKWPVSDAAPEGGWLAKTDGGIVYLGAPAVSDGQVYVGTIDFEGNGVPGVYAFDAATGARKWFFPTGRNVMTRVVAEKGRVFAQDDEWFVYALDAATGKLIWQFDSREVIGLKGAKLYGGADSHTRCALMLDSAAHRLYVGNARKSLFALDPEGGKVVWHVQDDRTHFLSTPSAATPCGDVVVGGIYWIGLFGYDAKTGKELWRHMRNNSSVTKEWYASGVPWIERVGFPVFHDGKLYMTSHSDFLEVDVHTGELLRRKTFPFSVICYTQPLFIGRRVYFGSQRNGLICFDLDKFELVWKAPVEESMLVTLAYQYPPIRSLSSAPVLWKGLVWSTCQDGALYAWDPATGERKRRIFTGAPYVASATVADDRLYTADFTGRIRCFV